MWFFLVAARGHDDRPPSDGTVHLGLRLQQLPPGGQSAGLLGLIFGLGRVSARRQGTDPGRVTTGCLRRAASRMNDFYHFTIIFHIYFRSSL